MLETETFQTRGEVPKERLPLRNAAVIIPAHNSDRFHTCHAGLLAEGLFWNAKRQRAASFNANIKPQFPGVFTSADVEAFAKAMETETKSDQDEDSKDKKDDDEDMSLDWQHWALLFNLLTY